MLKRNDLKTKNIIERNSPPKSNLRRAKVIRAVLLLQKDLLSGCHEVTGLKSAEIDTVEPYSGFQPHGE